MTDKQTYNAGHCPDVKKCFDLQTICMICTQLLWQTVVMCLVVVGLFNH